MSYTPTNWQTGDTITAEKMNNIEQGIVNAGGSKYDAYDYVLRQYGEEDIQIIKGSYAELRTKLAEGYVFGLFEWNSGVGSYGDVHCQSVPMSFTYYYSSADAIFCNGIYSEGFEPRYITIRWEANDEPYFD